MQRFLFISSLSLLLLVSPFGCFAIPSAANDQKINCEENYKSWMRDMSSHLENATITSIVLPGTHDSGAYRLYPQVLSGNSGKDTPPELGPLASFLALLNITDIYNLVLPWAQTQTCSIFDQLEHGIRFLDIRVGWDGNKFRLVHTLAGDDLEIALRDIARFTKANPSELIVINVGDFANVTSDATFQAGLELIISHLGEYMVPTSYNLSSTTYGNLIAVNLRVVVFTSISPTAEGELANKFFSNKHVLSRWSKADNVNDLITDQKEYIQNVKVGTSDLVIMSWILTISETRFAEVVLANISDLRDMSYEANNNTGVILADKIVQNKVNILMVDMYQDSGVVGEAVKLNRIKLNILDSSSPQLWRKCSRDVSSDQCYPTCWKCTISPSVATPTSLVAEPKHTDPACDSDEEHCKSPTLAPQCPQGSCKSPIVAKICDNPLIDCRSAGPASCMNNVLSIVLSGLLVVLLN